MVLKEVQRFGVSSRIVAETLRFDAGFYNQDVADALNALEQSGLEIVRLGDLVERVFIPNRVKRTYVGPEHGVPFLQGGQIIQLRPADLRYVSRAAQRKLEGLVVRAGWILVTRSGTVGRVVVTPDSWDSWAVSEHVLRIVPRSRASVPAGYIAAFLASPFGQAQLRAQIYGAVVDELTEDQTRSVRVPIPRDAGQRRRIGAIDKHARRARDLRSRAVLSTDAAMIEVAGLLPRTQPVAAEPKKHFVVSSDVVRAAGRFDAAFFNPQVARALQALRESPLSVKSLGEIAERIYIPPRFKRVYVDPEHGIPFLQGSHVPQFRPDDVRYLSTSAHERLERWIIEAGWILVTCSGSIGRVALAPRQWNGWAASQHILRVVPKDDPDCPPGFLAAFLASPTGQAQLTAQIYGAVVDELTEEQARSVQVPVARTPAQRRRVQEIADLTMQAVEHWADAAAATERAESAIDALIRKEQLGRNGTLAPMDPVARKDVAD